MPGEDKLAILEATYLLGLRVLRIFLELLSSSAGGFRQGITVALAERSEVDPDKTRKFIDFLLLLMSRMCALSVIGRVAGSVGTADIEQAYHKTLERVGENNATLLINLAVKIEHVPEFPENEIRDLHKRFSNNAFADTILADIVTARMAAADLDRRTRERMASLFKIPANDLLLIAPKKP